MTATYGHVLKLNRALDHLKDLESFTDSWVSGEHHMLIHEYDSNARTYSVFAESERPPRDPAALLIGDFLHGVRSALDHLAYALAVAHTKPLPKNIAEESEFPIFGDEDAKGQAGSGPRLFKNAADRKLRGVNSQARALIESVQPYKLGSDFKDHNLWLLYDLARIDRHRLLHLAVAYFSGFGFNVADELDCSGGGTVWEDWEVRRLRLSEWEVGRWDGWRRRSRMRGRGLGSVGWRWIGTGRRATSGSRTRRRRSSWLLRRGRRRWGRWRMPRTRSRRRCSGFEPRTSSPSSWPNSAS